MFGERIKQLRLEKNMTQERLGKLLNKTKNNISQYETGKRQPDIQIIKELATLFNVSVDYLLGLTDIRQPAEELIKKGTVTLKVEEPSEIEKISKELPEQERQELKNYANYLHIKSKLGDPEKEDSATSETIEEKKVN